jgi:hypothetical protein
MLQTTCALIGHQTHKSLRIASCTTRGWSLAPARRIQRRSSGHLEALFSVGRPRRGGGASLSLTDFYISSAHPAFGSLLSRRLAQASFASRLGALLHYHTTTTTALTRQSQLARDDTDRLRYRRAPLERAKSTARPPFRPSSSPSSRTAPARPNIGRAGRRLQTTA